MGYWRRLAQMVVSLRKAVGVLLVVVAVLSLVSLLFVTGLYSTTTTTTITTTTKTLGFKDNWGWVWLALCFLFMAAGIVSGWLLFSWKPVPPNPIAGPLVR
jgi:hypothetical protein